MTNFDFLKKDKQFDSFSDDCRFGESTFEKAESRLQKIAFEAALRRAAINESDINIVFAGDLLNQCIGSSFNLRATGIPFVIENSVSHTSSSYKSFAANTALTEYVPIRSGISPEYAESSASTGL